jgi:hypothetical protein
VTPAELTATELHTLYDEALDNLDAAMKTEDASGKAIDSMGRAYCEGYADAVAEVMRMGKVKA